MWNRRLGGCGMCLVGRTAAHGSVALLNTIMAMTHFSLWGGQVTPSVRVFDGNELRPADYIAADMVSVVLSQLTVWAMEYMGPDLAFALTGGSTALGLLMFAISEHKAVLCSGQILYSVGAAGTKLLSETLLIESAPLCDLALLRLLSVLPWVAFVFPPTKESKQKAWYNGAEPASYTETPAPAALLSANVLFGSVVYLIYRFAVYSPSVDRTRRIPKLHGPGIPVALCVAWALFLQLWLIQLDVSSQGLHWAVLSQVIAVSGGMVLVNFFHEPWFIGWLAEYLLPWALQPVVVNRPSTALKVEPDGGLSVLLFSLIGWVGDWLLWILRVAARWGQERTTVVFRRLLGWAQVLMRANHPESWDALKNGSVYNFCSLCMIWHCEQLRVRMQR